MRHYCTLFDRNYLAKGLCLHESLSRHSSEPFLLHILAMDQATVWLLQDLQLENVRVIPLSTFERDLNLQKIKEGRTWTEYCWTCASNLMEYLMPWVGPEGVTYCDADIYWFNNPGVIFDEIGAKSIGITPHRFPPHRKHKEINGKYNVGIVHARNSEAGWSCIAKWAANCRTWCFNRVEGLWACGDQKYLDNFEQDFPGEVCAIENPGVNTAPWNMDQYSIGVLSFPDGRTFPCVDGHPIVAFHFHEFRDASLLTNYRVRPGEREHIYQPYLAAWTAANERIKAAEDRAAEQRALIEMEAQRA